MDQLEKFVNKSMKKIIIRIKIWLTTNEKLLCWLCGI